VGKRERRQRVQELLETVGLSPEHYNRFPHEFSGGSGSGSGSLARSRCGEADRRRRAGVGGSTSRFSEMITCSRSCRRVHLTYIFMRTIWAWFRHVSDRIAVMYLGKLVELSPAEELYSRPIMPTRRRCSRSTDSRSRPLGAAAADRAEGDVPSPISPPSGCRFHPRCRYATDICSQVEPPLVITERAIAACHHR